MPRVGSWLLVRIGQPVNLRRVETIAAYVDSEEILWRGKLWCHLVADSLDELHAFAAKLGLRRTWFQSSGYPHYDVTVPMRARALKLGAVDADRETIADRCKRLKVELRQQSQTPVAPEGSDTLLHSAALDIGKSH